MCNFCNRTKGIILLREGGINREYTYDLFPNIALKYIDTLVDQTIQKDLNRLLTQTGCTQLLATWQHKHCVMNISLLVAGHCPALKFFHS